MRKLAVCLLLAAGAMMTSPAQATSFCLGGGCAPQPSSNVLVDKDLTGLSVTGSLNNAPGIVTFSSLESLISLANGQARVGALDGTLNNPLTIAFSGGLISALEFDIDALTDGKVSFSLLGGDSNGQVSPLFALAANGSNTYNAFDGTFSSITMNFSNCATVSDVSQVRLNAIALPPGPTAAAVPEPATWATMLLGFGVVGGVMRRQRRQTLRYSVV